MKYLRQFGIILAVTCAGEIMKYFIPLPIPGSIYGLILMFVLLLTKVIKVEHRRWSDHILEPAAVFSGAAPGNHSRIDVCSHDRYRKGYRFFNIQKRGKEVRWTI